jgi:hypothetical protein
VSAFGLCPDSFRLQQAPAGIVIIIAIVARARVRYPTVGSTIIVEFVKVPYAKTIWR